MSGSENVWYTGLYSALLSPVIVSWQVYYTEVGAADERKRKRVVHRFVFCASVPRHRVRHVCLSASLARPKRRATLPQRIVPAPPIRLLTHVTDLLHGRSWRPFLASIWT